MRRPAFSSKRIVFGVALVILIVPATLVLATDRFSDVPSSAYYHDSVRAIADAGITAGCGGGKFCPGDAVTRGQMAVFLNKLGALGAGTFPVANARSDLQTYCALRGRYPRSIPVGPCGGSATILTDTGYTPRIAVGADALPFVAYSLTPTGAPTVAHCAVAACTVADSTTSLDSGGGTDLDLAIGVDGFGILSYEVGTTQDRDLKVAHCTNVRCTSFDAPTTVDTANAGNHSQIAIGSDGLPVVAYYDNDLNHLKVAHCGNRACTAGNTTTDTNIDSAPRDIGIGTDGKPLIPVTTSDLKLAVLHCGNVSCTSGNAVKTLGGSVNPNGFQSALAVGVDGLPVIAHSAEGGSYVILSRCTTPTCQSGATHATVDIGGGIAQFKAMAIGLKGLPIIAYEGMAGAEVALTIAYCGNVGCTGGNTIIDVDPGPNHRAMSMVIPPDGVPVIAGLNIDFQNINVHDVIVVRPPVGSR